ncbi:MAG: hypothetical protein AAFR59_19830, partial [Bacteroidota bacterium]
KVALDFAQGIIFNIGAPRAPVRHVNGGYFRDIHLSEDGSIIAAGAVYYNDFSYFRCGLVKFLPDGRVDSSFYNNGVLAFEPPSFATGDRFIDRMEILPDGRIVMSIQINSTPQNFALAVLDPVLNELTYPSLDFDGNFDFIEDMLPLPDGKVFLVGRSILPSNFTVGYTSDQTALARLNGSLLPDNSFGNNGKLLFDIDSELKDGAYTLTLAINGDILVAGNIDDPTQGFGEDLYLLRIKGETSTSISDALRTKIRWSEDAHGLQINWSGDLSVEEVRILDLQGRLLHQENPLPGAYTTWVSTEAMQAGLYLIQIESKGQ